MAHTDADIAAMVFRQAVIKSTGAFSLDRKAIAILLEFDGCRTVAQIAHRLNLDRRNVLTTVRHLSRLGLIEPAAGAAEALDRAVIDRITQHLARAVGPLAMVIVEEEIQELGYKVDGFPVVRLIHLIERLSGCIRKKDKRIEFLAAVADLVRTK